MKIGFLGLGVMGRHMARHLKERGSHDVTVYNRTKSKAQAWVAENGGRLGDSPADTARGQDAVVCCLGNDNDLREVLAGPDGAIAAMSAGAILIDSTTASAQVARELAELGERHAVGFIDAPVSGGEAGAENGTLSAMCGGAPDVFERAFPVISHYARTVRLLGPSGSGQLTKMVNQICIAGVLQGLAEGIHFAQRSNLDVEAVLEVIAGGAAGSWQMNNRGATMNRNEYNFGFAVDWMRKDLGICLDEARKNGATLSMTALIDQYYSDVQKKGGGRWDTSSLLKRLSSN